MIGWVYLLHFEKPLAHARHYVGSTRCLRQRLTNHAHGRGSRLTRELWKQGIRWELAALFQASRETMRMVERLAKDQHQASRFCPRCSRREEDEGMPYVPPGCSSYAIENLPFEPLSSKLAKNKGVGAIQILPSSEETRDSVEDAIIRLMKWDGNALGWIPVGGKEGMTTLINTGRVMLATHRRQIVGYAAWTFSHDESRIKIHQLCVDDAYRLCGIGSRLLDAIQDHDRDADMVCTVRSDLPANDFWQRAGFTVTQERQHKTSGSTLIDYERTALNGV